MSLKKRKSKLTELFPEREALRVRPIKPKTNNIKTSQHGRNARNYKTSRY